MSSGAPVVVTLGTAGGPVLWGGDRHGIATAVLVGDRSYLVDCGYGVARQLKLAGIPFPSLRAVFLTHLHSDHVLDLSNVVLQGLYSFPDGHGPRVVVLGPGDRGTPPPVSPHATAPVSPVFPEEPTPGTARMFDLLMRAQATDINDRVLDSLRAAPGDLFEARDITVPSELGFHPDDAPDPDCEPFVVFEDDRVQVHATLVKHPPVAPAFAYRFTTEGGSVTISGDTAPSENLVRLAHGSDLLLHEAIDVQWVEEYYSAERFGDERHARIDHHRRSHTSIEEAGRVATAAGVHTLALHHLVPGAGPSRWADAGRTFAGRVLVPDDLDRISVGATA